MATREDEMVDPEDETPDDPGWLSELRRRARMVTATEAENARLRQEVAILGIPELRHLNAEQRMCVRNVHGGDWEDPDEILATATHLGFYAETDELETGGGAIDYSRLAEQIEIRRELAAQDRIHGAVAGAEAEHLSPEQRSLREIAEARNESEVIAAAAKAGVPIHYG